MQQKILTGLLAFTLTLAFSLWHVPVMAQSPYWDNSGGDQTFYNPGNTQSNPAPAYSNPNPGYGNPSYGSNGGYNQPYGTGAYGQPQPPLRGYVSTAPAGTTMSVSNTTFLSTEHSRIGDPVTTTLTYDLAMGGNIVLPSGSQIQGEVVSSIPAGRTGRHGELQIRFKRALLPDGRQVPLSARLVTQDGTGVIRGGTTARRVGGVAKNTLGGAAIGAAAGTALGAIVGGGNRWNEGLLWGSILGAGSGLVRSGWQRGEEAELQPGTQLQIMLDQPLTVTPSTGQYPPPY